MSYNHAQFVEESLNSVLSQTYENIELLIADDCSTDNSKAVIEQWLKKHLDITFISNPTNIGNTKTFNKLLALSKGDYIIDLAADDVLLPDCVEKQLFAFQNSKFKNTGIVYGNAEMISENNEHLGYYFETDEKLKTIIKPASGDIYMAILSQSSKICSVSSLVKREVIENLGGYDENLAYEDLDLWIRASRLYNFEFIDEILIQKREVPSSLGNQFFKKSSKRTRKINYSSYLVIKKAIQLNKTKEENKALLKRMHYEMMKAWQSCDFILLLKYFPLEIWLRIK
ncbi:glycosyltransferase [Flavobacterium sp. N1946]|uniref:glycosyltransferase n=1 Tax=Flavobacterium TaxID=237 RepID=UPI001FCA9EE3|nr:glycosyltransferase [Flavobacterium enshiense]